MSLALGVFDLFTYTAAGAVYLAVLVFLGHEAGLDLGPLAAANTTLLLVGGLLASYLLGHATYFLGALLDRFTRGRAPDWPALQRRFLARARSPRARELIRLDPVTLLSAIEVYAKEAALEVARLRAVGLMLRNAAPALVIAAVIAVVEGAGGNHPWLSAASAVLLLAAAAGLCVQGMRMRSWAVSKTYELCYWLPEVTDHARALPPEPDRPG
jgi:hypothetical protein